MKAIAKTLLLAVACAIFGSTFAYAQRQLGKKKGPTSKLFLAESKGGGSIQTEGRILEPKQATAFDAPGTIIETSQDSYQAFVYSNGTGMYLDEDTRVEIDRFVQEPFQPERNSTETEPSISQSDVFISHGFVGICTSQLISGTSMIYSTPQASVNIRGQKLAIDVKDDVTTVYLLEGDVTVRSGTRDVGGVILRPGEKATIRQGAPGTPPTITVDPIEKEIMNTLDDRVSVACNVKKTVAFESMDKDSTSGGGDSEINANPIVPAAPPVQITVSPDRLQPGGG